MTEPASLLDDILGGPKDNPDYIATTHKTGNGQWTASEMGSTGESR